MLFGYEDIQKVKFKCVFVRSDTAIKFNTEVVMGVIFDH